MGKTQPIIMLHALFDEILHNQKQIKTILLFIYFFYVWPFLTQLKVEVGKKANCYIFPDNGRVPPTSSALA